VIQRWVMAALWLTWLMHADQAWSSTTWSKTHLLTRLEIHSLSCSVGGPVFYHFSHFI